MKMKRKFGMGLKKTITRKTRMGRGISLFQAISKPRKRLKGKHFKSLNDGIKTALKSIGNRTVLSPKERIIPIPKTGEFLPLIPLFAGVSALGAAVIAKAVNDAVGKQGSGLYLKLYKTGCGLYLKP